ncbi:TIGR02678 family protein [Oceanobacillus picturae]|uniref:TIGR02678 family protein n=1 Tax=Oceanobacillus picturae TaxID=171693 RepID=UPI000E69AA8E|nr:TIGR02678 family protein [Oceanobacillus picturae]RIU94443.1 TIGR02678 family protein [Oceanobacillus picturae]
MEITTFDEKAQTGLRLLFEKFWILRSKEPEVYQQIREREKIIKRYVDEKFGFDLIVHQHFIKLEKIPVETKSWMGMQGFLEPRDYAMFCCALAFTENRTVDEQFLLSDVCEDIKDLYPGEFPLDWTNYNHRKSLVRVIKQLEKLSILAVVEGEIEQFALNEEQEVLYEVTVYARYFMRSYPKDLVQYKSIEEILEGEWERHETDARRKRVYRKLLFSPAVHRESEQDPDFAYIRNFRNRLRDDMEEHTLFRFELFRNAAMLVTDERKQELTLFPDQKAIMDVALHFSHYLRNNQHEYVPDTLGNIHVTTVAFEQIVTQLHAEYGKGWSKQYREGTVKQTMQELATLMGEWEMLERDPFTGEYLIKPLAGRLSGHYPKNFDAEKGVTNEKTQ